MADQPLEEIFLKWRTDKVKSSEEPNGFAEFHGYAGVYECLFHEKRRSIKAVLEIGIGTMLPDVPSTMVGWALPGYKPGGSLRAWREYFENAVIVGLDIQPDTQFSGEDRIMTFLVDSTSELQVDHVMKHPGMPRSFDLIIDDGFHNIPQQTRTLKNFFPYLRESGIYIIEDLAESLDISNNLKDICSSSPFFFAGPYCNILVIMKREASGK